jgi:hypothetical protein
VLPPSWQTSLRLDRYVEAMNMDTDTCASFLKKWAATVADTCSRTLQTWHSTCRSRAVLDLTIPHGFSLYPTTPLEQRRALAHSQGGSGSNVLTVRRGPRYCLHTFMHSSLVYT